jgi:hypothetical protein
LCEADNTADLHLLRRTAGALALRMTECLGCLFEPALRNAKEYDQKVEYTHLNPVKAGLVRRAQDRGGPSLNEHSGMSAPEQERRCSVAIERVRMFSDARTRI